jgi:hypothetical protein
MYLRSSLRAAEHMHRLLSLWGGSTFARAGNLWTIFLWSYSFGGGERNIPWEAAILGGG